MDEKSSLTRNDLEQSMMDSDLTYLAKNSSSLVIERTTKRMYADNPQYGSTNKNLVVNFQTGVDYIDGRNSYLKALLEVTKVGGTSPTASFGYGTALNLIESVKVVSRSGTVLGRIERVNLLQYYETKYNNSYSWFGSNDADNLMGVGVAGGLLAYDDTKSDITSVEINIPLTLIHPFFDQHNLLPSMVCKGLRLEIILADGAVAFVGGGTVAPTSVTYTLSNVWCSLDSYRLTDDAMRKLNDMSREPEGLVLQYHDWENSQFTRSGVTTLSAEVRKSVSMANSAFAVTRLQANITEVTVDSFLAQELNSADQYQWRVGSMYMPQTELKGPRSWYSNANYCKGTLKSHAQPFVRYSHPTATVPSFTSSATAGGCYAVACVDLDRYWLDLSGLAINNSVTLNLGITYGDGEDAAKLDLFLKHTRRIAVFDSNIVVLD